MRSTMTLVAVAVFVALGCAKSPEPAASTSNAPAPATATVADAGKLSAADAFAAAKKALGTDGPWNLAFVSTTGVSQSVKATDPADAMIGKDGKAGQWVFEFYKDTPTPTTHDGQEGFKYPFRVVSVTSAETTPLPDSDMGVPTKLVTIDDQAVGNIDTVVKNASGAAKAPFDAMSIASDVGPNRPLSWRFRFYDLKSRQIVGKATVSPDGKVLESE
jgi:hypothetical protein